jgi:hypothetical protein
VTKNLSQTNNNQGNNSSYGTMSTSGKAESTTPYNLNPSFPSNTVVFKEAYNCRDFGGSNKSKTELL